MVPQTQEHSTSVRRSFLASGSWSFLSAESCIAAISSRLVKFARRRAYLLRSGAPRRAVIQLAFGVCAEERHCSASYESERLAQKKRSWQVRGLPRPLRGRSALRHQQADPLKPAVEIQVSALPYVRHEPDLLGRLQRRRAQPFAHVRTGFGLAGSA